jgi:type II secretion system protein G
MRNNTTTFRGFTLIELMIVIVILGVLVTMISGAFVTSQKKSRDLRRKSDLNQVSRAMQMYNNDFGSYPLSDTGRIMGCTDGTTLCTPGNVWSTTTTTYMVQLPQESNSGNAYYYDSPDGKTFQMYAYLENKDDPDIPKVAGVNKTYAGTNCGAAGACNYGISSSNISVTTNHALQ